MNPETEGKRLLATGYAGSLNARVVTVSPAKVGTLRRTKVPRAPALGSANEKQWRSARVELSVSSCLPEKGGKTKNPTETTVVLKPLLPYVLIVLVWAGMYLPGLGVLEIRGEEGRRLLPAVSMLDGGSLFVPHIGDVPYLKKPPLVNWLVAASFAVTGHRNEWTARLPSVLAVLALALGMYVATRGWLGPDYARFAALALLTTVEMVDKGRLIEIDALYTAAFGLALVAWIDGSNRSPWRRWILPGIFLAIGLLL